MSSPQGTQVNSWSKPRVANSHPELTPLIITTAEWPLSPLGTQAGGWSKPRVANSHPERSCQNPVLWYDAEAGELHLYHTSQAANKGQGTALVIHRYSKDLGDNWSPERTVELPDQKGPFVRNQLLLALNGDWLMPMYYTPGA